MAVRRGRRARVEAGKDLEWVRWIGRFRFVDAAVLSARFGLSVAAVNVRLRRLEAAGWVVLDGSVPGVPRVVHVSSEGGRAIGISVPPRIRAGVQREHELLIAGIVSASETAGSRGLVCFTEREGRRRQVDGGSAHSVRVLGATNRLEARWPDLVLERDGRRAAVEVELSPKPSGRLRRILEGYAVSGEFAEVRWICQGQALTTRVERLARQAQIDTGPRFIVRQLQA